MPCSGTAIGSRRWYGLRIVIATSDWPNSHWCQNRNPPVRTCAVGVAHSLTQEPIGANDVITEPYATPALVSRW